QGAQEGDRGVQARAVGVAGGDLGTDSRRTVAEVRIPLRPARGGRYAGDRAALRDADGSRSFRPVGPTHQGRCRRLGPERLTATGSPSRKAPPSPTDRCRSSGGGASPFAPRNAGNESC